jgi:hypothetical protein
MFKLSQTLAGNWVITVPNPEERHWETQMADFNYEAVSGQAEAAMDKGVVACFTAFITAFEDRGWQVTSHNPAAVQKFEALVKEALGQKV